jgi:hypothetical protein
MANSLPFTLANDQPPIDVTATISGTPTTLDGGPDMGLIYFRSGGAVDIMNAGLTPTAGKSIQLIDLLITSDAVDVADLVDGTIDDVLYLVAGINAQMTMRGGHPPFTVNGVVQLTVVGAANVTAYGCYREV